MKKLVLLSLCVMMALTCLSGCAVSAPAPAESAAPVQSAGPEPEPEAAPGAFGVAENEIAFYERLEEGKTPLVVSETGNIYITGLCDAFEAANPDVQIFYINLTGGNSSCSPPLQWLKNGCAPDVMIYSTGIVPVEMQTDYLENLSSRDYVSAYNMEALDRIAVDHEIYAVPGPSKIDCIMYNKTLFDQYGWEVPNTFDEFADLCVKIREDTDGAIEPWNPNAKYDNELLNCMEAFFYSELFAGVDNRTWYRELPGNEVSFSDHMRPMYEGMARLIADGTVRPEHFSYSATSRWNEFLAGSIAMVNFTATSNFSDSQYEYGFMPFPGRTAEECYISDAFSCGVSIPEKERTAEVSDAAERFMAFLSSVEGQQSLIGNTINISNLEDFPPIESGHLAALQSTLDAGHTFSRISFSVQGMSLNFSLYEDFKAMAFGELTAEEALAANEAKPRYVPAEVVTAEPPAVLGTLAEDFTILETSFLLADMYRESAGADIGLIMHNVTLRGNVMRLFAGELTAGDVTVLKPRSFANGSTLVKVKVTGAELLNILNAPTSGDDEADCVYAYSGLRCTVAPWNAPGGRYLSVALADGTPIDEAGEYTLAVWGGTVADEYTAEPEAAIEGSFEELMTAYLGAHSPISPADDGRITLVWD